MVMEIVDRVFDDGFKGAGMVLLLVVAYKIYKAKISNEIESNCCEGFKWKFVGKNDGGQDLDTRLSGNV
jgi:hypothetical protein|tara:strand:- start:67 stop:273 length:207 start_codon:yes stop_codon:yes gene_type:complete